MGVDLMMERFAGMYQNESLQSGIIDEFYFRDVDVLFEYLEMEWENYAVDIIDDNGRLPHEASVQLLKAVETHPVPEAVDAPNIPRQFMVDRRERLLDMLRLYCYWYDRRENIPAQIQGILRGRAAGMVDKIAHLHDRRPWLALALP